MYLLFKGFHNFKVKQKSYFLLTLKPYNVSLKKETGLAVLEHPFKKLQ
jgi:hypothetical protein